MKLLKNSKFTVTTRLCCYILFSLIITKFDFAQNNHLSSNFQLNIHLQSDSIIYVDDNNIISPWNGTKQHPFRYIPDGFAIASTGVTVYVLPGTYSIANDIIVNNGVLLFLDSCVIIKFNATAGLKVNGSLMAYGSRNDSIVFTSALPTGTWKGMRFEDATEGSEFRFCRLENATGNPSGAVYVKNTAVIFYDCLWQNNNAVYGAGLYCDNLAKVTLTECLFTDNISSIAGGGLFATQTDSLIIKNCIFENNSATQKGGAVYLINSKTHLSDNIFNSNEALNGGAIYLDGLTEDQINLSWNHFEENAATANGGALFVSGCAPNNITRNLFLANTANQGGAVSLNNSSIQFINNTIYQNTSTLVGGGLFSTSGDNGVVNNIFWDNLASDSSQLAGTGITASFNNLMKSFPGNGNITEEPVFVDTGFGNFHLQNSSPCINAGDPLSPDDPDSTRADMGLFYTWVIEPAIEVSPDSIIAMVDSTGVFETEMTISNWGNSLLLYNISTQVGQMTKTPMNGYAPGDDKMLELGLMVNELKTLQNALDPEPYNQALNRLNKQRRELALLPPRNFELWPPAQAPKDNGFLNTGMAASFDGNGDYINIPDDDSLDLNGNQMCVEAWIYINSYAGDYRCILGKIGWSDVSAWGYNIHINDTGGLHFNIINTNGTEFPINSPAVVGNGKWHHIAATYNGTLIKIFIDGIEVNSRTANGNIRQNSYETRIGAWCSTDPNYFNGKIDEVRIWKYARSEDEIQSNMYSPLSGNEEGLVGYWPLNGNALDITGNGNNGTLVGNTTFVHPDMPLMNPTHAYTSFDVPKTIGPNSETVTTSTIEITDGYPISDLDVIIDLNHTFDADLTLILTSPSGTSVTLASFNGGSGDNYKVTIFDDEAATSITSGTAPFNGYYKPIPGPLNLFDGETINGVWTLKITDYVNGDGGTLNNWSLRATQSGAAWIMIDPIAGGLDPNQTQTVNLTFNPGYLNPGEYHADLIVTSNDQVQPQVIIPTTTYIEGYPNLLFSADTIDFNYCYLGLNATLPVTLYNWGNGELNVSGFSFSEDVFTVDNNVFTIGVGSTAAIHVTFTPANHDTLYAQMTIISNDIPKSIVLRGFAITAPTIALQPASFSATLPTGQQQSQNLSITNSGQFPLEYSTEARVIPVETFNQQMYVANRDANTISAINLTTGAIIGTKTVPNTPHRLALNDAGTTLWITCENTGAASFFQVEKFTDPWASPTNITISGNSTSGTAITHNNNSPYAGYAYIGNPAMNRIDEVNLSTAQVLNYTATNVDPVALALAPDGINLYVLSLSYLHVFNTFTKQFTQIAADLTNGYGLALNPDGKWLYVSHKNYVRKYNTVTMFQTGSLGNFNYAKEMAVSPDGTKLAVADNSNSRVSIVKCSDMTLLANVTVPGTPVGLSISEDGNFVYVTLSNTNVIRQIRLTDYALTSLSIATGISPCGLILPRSVTAPWAYTQPTNGSVAAGVTNQTAMVMNATGLLAGSYTGKLWVNSSDPFNPKKTASLTLNVSDAPAINLSADSLIFADSVFVGLRDSLQLIVTNNGFNTLTVTGITHTNPVFTAEPTAFTLSPAATKVVKFYFQPTQTGYFTDNFTVLSNVGNKTVFVAGNGLMPPVISVPVAFIQQTLDAGSSASKTLTISNNGGSNLNYEAYIRDTLKVNYAAIFDGNDDYLKVNNSYPNLNEITLEAWIYPMNVSGGQKFIFSTGRDCCTPTGGFNLYLYNETLQGHVWRSASGQLFGVSSSNIIKANQWQHVSMTYNGMQLKLFLNGEEVAVSAVNSLSSIQNGSNNLHIGILGYSVPSFYEFVGRIDEARIWNYAMDKEDIKRNLIKNLNGDETGLLGYWNFDGSNPWIDLTNKGNNAQPFGNAQTIISNLFLYLKPSWVNIAANWSGSVPSFGSLEVPLFFDANNLIGGNYSAKMKILNNDPFHPEINLPVTLTVHGTPIATLSYNNLAFGSTYIGETNALTVSVKNTGNDTLLISGYNTTNPVFSTQELNIGLAVNDSTLIEIQYQPQAAGLDEGEITLQCNTTTAPVVQVSGVAVDPPVIAANPVSINDTVIIGDIAKHNLILSNNGGSDLEYDLSFIHYGDGSDGILNVNTGATYYTDAIKSKVEGINQAGQNTITLNTATGFSVDDEVLIITMQDAQADTLLNVTGRYEVHHIYSIYGNKLKLTKNLLYAYDQSVNMKHQVIRIPQFSDVVVNGTLTCDAWNGEKGGVVFFRSNGSVTINSTGIIDASGKGYRGGTGPASQSDYQYGYAGERTMGNSASREVNGLEKLSGGGGTGKGADGSGGGGSYGSNGTNGGKNLANSDYGRGASSFGTPNLNKLFFGGGGGSSGSHSAGRYGVAGGNGGGIINISAKTINNYGNIKALGSNGTNGVRIYDASSGAGGGGGAGGSIMILADELNTISGYIKAEGGVGGIKATNSNGYNGGNGGYGRIRIEAMSLENSAHISPVPSLTYEKVQVNWINASPLHGIIPPAQKDTVNISLLGYLVGLGNHSSQIKIQSNDITTGMLSLPVNLTVNPGVGIFVPDTVAFNTVPLNTISTKPLIIKNVGTSTLLISDINLTSSYPVFSISDSTFSIPASSRDTLWVTFQPDSAMWYEAGLQILSNDPTDPVSHVVLTGNGISDPKIAVAPESFAVVVPQNDSLMQTLTINNTGGSDLEFNIQSVNNIGFPYVDPDFFELKTNQNGHRYYISRQTSYWEDAKNTCIRWGGHLATISNSTENEIVKQIAISKGSNLWIGFSDKNVEGTWTWVTGEPVVYTNWASGQPDNYNGIEDYLEYYYSGTMAGKWNDAPNELTRYYVLEIDNDTDSLITFNQFSGTIPRFGSQDINVTFRTENLDYGVYDSDIRILSNDPAQDTLLIPVSVTAPPPVIEVTPESFTEVIHQYDSLTKTLTINNIGESDLSYQIESLDTFGGVSGKAASFDGNGDYLDTNYDYSWSNSESFTIEFWFKPNAATNQVIIGKGFSSDWEYAFILESSLNARLIYWNTSAQWALNISCGTIELGKWNQMAVTYNGVTKTGTGYINGNLISTSSVSTTFQNRTASTVIGRGYYNNGVGYYTNGEIDELHIWNYARSQQEIQSTRYSTLSGNETGLVGYWNFNETNPWQNLSGNGNNGTAYGNATTIVSTAPINAPHLIAFDIESGTIPRFCSHNINVTFHTDNLDFDTYAANIQIISNDPVQDTLLVPVSVTVPPPVIEVAPESFTEIIPKNDSLTKTLTINNTGGSDLNYQIKSLDIFGAAAGNAVSFDGNGDYIQIPDNPLWDFGLGDFTIEMWVNYINISGSNTIIEIGNWTSSIIVRQDNSSQLVLYIWGASYVFSFAPILNNWYTLTIRRTSGQLEVFVNGSKLGSSVGCTHNIQISNVIRIGSSVHATGQYFNGKMDEVRIWNHSRTLLEIQSTMNTTLSGNESGLVGYWNFNKTNPWEDLTGNGNDGTANGNVTSILSTAPINVQGLCTFSIESDIIPRFGSQDINVTFHTANLDFDNYETNIQIISNDPVQDTLLIPVSVTVPPPVVGVTPDSLFATIFSGDTTSLSFEIANSGLSKMDYSVESDDSFCGGGKAAKFDLGYLVTPTNEFNPSAMTLEMWVKPDFNGNDGLSHGFWQTRNDNSPNGNNWVSFFKYSDNNFYFRVCNSSGTIQDVTFNAAANFMANNWMHIACVYSSSGMWVYINGVLKVSRGAIGTPVSHYAESRIGYGHIAPFDGDYDEVRVWNYARTQAEIQSTLGHVLIGNEPGLSGYWSFDKTNPWYDLSGHENQGTPSGNVISIVSTAPLVSSSTVISPENGTVLYNSAQSIIGSINLSYVPEGFLNFNFLINSNDPIHETIHLPVELTILPAAGIDITSDTLYFDDTFVMGQSSLPFSIESIGSQALEFSITPAYSNVFAFTGYSSGNVLPGESKAYTFYFTPNTVKTEIDSIIISTNDPTDPIKTVYLVGTGLPKPQVGLDPLSLVVNATTQATIPENIQLINTGGSTLEYDYYLRTKSDPAKWHYAYVVNYNSNSLSIINLDTKTVTHKSGFYSRPVNIDMTPDGQYLWITYDNDNEISIYHIPTGNHKVISTPNLQIYGSAFSPDGSIAYIANKGSARIDVYNTSTFELLSTFSMHINNPQWTDITNDGKLLYVSDFGSKMAVVIDVESGNEVAALSGFTGPWGMELSPDGRWFAFADGNTSKIGSTISNTIVRTVPNINNTRPPVWSSDSKYLFVGSWDNSKIYKIETQYFMVVKEYSLSYKVWSIHLTEDNKYLMASCYDNDVVGIIDLDTGVISYVAVQDGPTTITTFRTKQPQWIDEITLPDTLVAPFSYKTIDMTINTTDIPGGDYHAELPFVTNDPLSESFVYDITLHHNTGVPNICTMNDTLDFGEVWVGYPDSLLLTIKNTGTVPLEITSLTGSPGQFYLTSDQISLTPEQEYELMVYCMADAPGNLDGTLQITSNAGEKSIFLTANALEPPLINVFPEALDAYLLPDETEQQNMVVSNNGVSNLGFSNALRMHKDKMLVCNENQSTLHILDAGTNESQLVTLPYNGPWKAAFSPDGKTIWITYKNAGYVTVLDASNYSIIKNKYMGSSRTSGVAFNATGTFAYIGNWNENRLEIVNTADFEWTGSITGSVSQPMQLLSVPEKQELYVLNGGNNKLVVINMATNTEITALTGSVTNRFIALSPDQESMYWVGGTVVNKINTTTRTIIKTSGAYGDLRGATITGDGKTLYVASYGYNRIISLETQNLTLTDEFYSWDQIWRPLDVALSSEEQSLLVMLEGKMYFYEINLPENKFVKQTPFTGTGSTFTGFATSDLISWVSTEIVKDTISQNSEKILPFNFNSFGLSNGQYEAMASIFSNDPSRLTFNIPVHLSISDQSVQKLTISDGWSGVSSYVIPTNKNLTSLFQPILDELIILQSETGMFWPGQNLNTIGLWSTQKGYKIKVSEASELTIYGDLETDKTLPLSQGWNLIPVIGECETDVVTLFAGKNLTIVKEVAGYRLYWPAYGINTLEYLESGNAYFVLMGSSGVITYPACDGLKTGFVKRDLIGIENLLGLVPWKLSKTTASTHTIAIPSSAFLKTTIKTGDILAAFDETGNCYGITKWNNQNSTITIFGDDPLTDEKDGFVENDFIKWRVYNPESKVETGLFVAWDSSLPQHDGLFHTNGLSAIKVFKVAATGYQTHISDGILIFPNPAKDQLNIIVPELDGRIIQITNVQGQQVFSGKLNNRHTILDISQFEKGLYFVMIFSERQNWVEKVVVE